MFLPNLFPLSPTFPYDAIVGNNFSVTDSPCRDDLTVEVIFFGEGNESGDVTLNAEATAPNLGAKAKL